MQLRKLPIEWLRRAQDGLERRVVSQHEDVVLEPSRRWVRGITWSLVGLTTFGVAWVALARTEEIIVVPGRLEPIGQVTEIQMPTGGVARKILVKEGQMVAAGQALMELDSESQLDRRQASVVQIGHKRAQLAQKQEELARFLEFNTTQQQVLSQNLGLQKEILRRFTRLSAEGAGAELQTLQQRDKVLEVEGQLRSLRVDRLRQQAELQQAIEVISGELREAENRLVEAKVNLRYQVLRAPVAGMVFDLKPTATGFVARDTQTVMKVVPSGALQAKLEIPSRDIGFVFKGQPVDVSIDSYPASDFGVISGKVTRIGSDALAPESPEKPDYRYPAVVHLDEQRLLVRGRRSLPLQAGMSLKANLKLRPVSYLQLLLGSFREKSDALRRTGGEG